MKDKLEGGIGGEAGYLSRGAADWTQSHSSSLLSYTHTHTHIKHADTHTSRNIHMQKHTHTHTATQPCTQSWSTVFLLEKLSLNVKEV